MTPDSKNIADDTEIVAIEAAFISILVIAGCLGCYILMYIKCLNRCQSTNLQEDDPLHILGRQSPDLNDRPAPPYSLSGYVMLPAYSEEDSLPPYELQSRQIDAEQQFIPPSPGS